MGHVKVIDSVGMEKRSELEPDRIVTAMGIKTIFSMNWKRLKLNRIGTAKQMVCDSAGE